MRIVPLKSPLFWFGEGIDIPHPEPDIDKVEAEGALATTIFIYNGEGGSTIEELLIGVEESPPVLKILVAVLVEHDQSLEIGRHQSPWRRGSCSDSFEQMKRRRRFCCRRVLGRRGRPAVKTPPTMKMVVNGIGPPPPPSTVVAPRLSKSGLGEINPLAFGMEIGVK
ncbi:hypothetical protein U1Q18_027865 [Sarracenia purpurea var. burkii]